MIALTVVLISLPGCINEVRWRVKEPQAVSLVTSEGAVPGPLSTGGYDEQTTAAWVAYRCSILWYR